MWDSRYILKAIERNDCNYFIYSMTIWRNISEVNMREKQVKRRISNE